MQELQVYRLTTQTLRSRRNSHEEIDSRSTQDLFDSDEQGTALCTACTWFLIILHMQISAPFCFDCGGHLGRSFAAAKLLAGHSVCLWRYAPISMGRWMIFFIFVDFWSFLSLARGLYAYNINIWSLCEGERRLKLIRGLSWSAPQTSMMLPTLLRSAAQRTIERLREVEVDSYELFTPRGRKRLTKGSFYGPGCFNNSVEDRVRVLLFAKGNAKDKAQSSRSRGLCHVRLGARPGA